MTIKSRAAIMKGYKQPFSIEEINLPSPTGEAVIVKIAGAGVCHGDLHLWKGEFPGFPSPIPIVLGHENSGVIYETGENVPSEFKKGTPVLVFGGWYETEDEFTQIGEQQHARRPIWPGYIKYNGGHSEYLYVPSYKFLLRADDIEDLASAATFTDSALTSYRPIKKLRPYVSPDDWIVIVGLGGLGLFGSQYAKYILGTKTIFIDIRDEPLNFLPKILKIESEDVLINASKENAVEKILDITRKKGVRAVVDFVGSTETLENYIKVLDTKGIYIIVGTYSPFVPQLPLLNLILKEYVIMTSLWGSYKELQEVANLARRKIIKYKELVTKIKLEDITQALEKLDKGEVVGRQIIVP
jgi:D-arabinose 1-dehydrogenase-like Zn-dependent alcohol dehydrogenase